MNRTRLLDLNGEEWKKVFTNPDFVQDRVSEMKTLGIVLHDLSQGETIPRTTLNNTANQIIEIAEEIELRLAH